MQERDKVCGGPLKGGTPYDQQVGAKEKTYKKGSRFVSDLSRVLQHMITRSNQKRAYIESHKICFWPLKGGTPSDFRPRKRTTWWNVDNVVICPY